MRGRWRTISVIPTTAMSLASTTVSHPAARMRSPPRPKTSKSGRRRRRASISCAPYMSPEASPAETRMRSGRAVVEEVASRWSLVVGKGSSVTAQDNKVQPGRSVTGQPSPTCCRLPAGNFATETKNQAVLFLDSAERYLEQIAIRSTAGERDDGAVGTDRHSLLGNDLGARQLQGLRFFAKNLANPGKAGLGSDRDGNRRAVLLAGVSNHVLPESDVHPMAIAAPQGPALPTNRNERGRLREIDHLDLGFLLFVVDISAHQEPRPVRRNGFQGDALDDLLRHRRIGREAIHDALASLLRAVPDAIGPRSYAAHVVAQLPRRKSALRRCHPKLTARLAGRKRNLLIVGHEGVLIDLILGKDGFGVAVANSGTPQMTAGGSHVCRRAHEEIKVFSIPRKGAEVGETGVAFEGDLPLLVVLAEPQGRALNADGSDEGLAVGGHGDAFFFGWPRGDLLRFTIREALPPDVEGAAGVGGEVHPGAVWAPGGFGAGSLQRANRPPAGASVERHQAAGHPFAVLHLNHQRPLAVGGSIGAVGHGGGLGRKVDHALAAAVFAAA